MAFDPFGRGGAGAPNNPASQSPQRQAPAAMPNPAVVVQFDNQPGQREFSPPTFENNFS